MQYVLTASVYVLAVIGLVYPLVGAGLKVWDCWRNSGRSLPTLPATQGAEVMEQLTELAEKCFDCTDVLQSFTTTYLDMAETVEPSYSDVWEYPGYEVIEDAPSEDEVYFPSYENTPVQDEEPVSEYQVIAGGAIAIDVSPLPTIKEIKALARGMGVKGCNPWKAEKAYTWYREVYLAQ